MKIDPVKLEKAIDNMSSVCEKGRAEIKTMLSEGFGVEFKGGDKGIMVSLGDRVSRNGCEYIVCSMGSGKRGLINIKSGIRYADSITVDPGIGHHIKTNILDFVSFRDQQRGWEKI